MKHALTRLRDTARALGPRSTFFYALSRAGLDQAVRSYLLVAQPVAETPRLPARRAAAFSSREIGPTDPALAAMPIAGSVVNFRFGQGARCLGLFRGETLAAYAWFCLNGYDEDEVRCRFEPRPAHICAWDFDVYVLPDHRASFAFLALWDAADRFLRSQGREVSVSRISAFNLGSVRSHARLGAKQVGRSDFVRFGGLQLAWSDLGNRRHLSLTVRRRPVIPVPVPQAACKSGPVAATHSPKGAAKA
ncbi:MAG: N-acetyltransferase [Rhodothalassiaceae bacterium]